MVCEIDGQVNGGRLHGHASSTRVNYAWILSNPSSTKPDTLSWTESAVINIKVFVTLASNSFSTCNAVIGTILNGSFIHLVFIYFLRMKYNLEVSFHYFYLYLTLINSFEKDMSKVCKMSQIFEQKHQCWLLLLLHKKGILVPKKANFCHSKWDYPYKLA